MFNYNSKCQAKKEEEGMAKNPDAKKARKKKLADKQRAKNAELNAQRAAKASSNGGNNAKRGKKGSSPTLKQCHGKTSAELRMMVERKMPGYQNAMTVLSAREQTAGNQRKAHAYTGPAVTNHGTRTPATVIATASATM